MRASRKTKKKRTLSTYYLRLYSRLYCFIHSEIVPRGDGYILKFKFLCVPLKEF